VSHDIAVLFSVHAMTTIKSSDKAGKNTEAPECECGCGGKTKGGRFQPGHDAILKKALVQSALVGGKRAIAKLEALGWTKFLDTAKEKQRAAAASRSDKVAQKSGKARASKAGNGRSEAPATLPKPSAPKARRRSAAVAAAEAAPNLDPPLSEEAARILGFGDESSTLTE
jgi:hypothetical protein